MSREEALERAHAFALKYGCEFEESEDEELWSFMVLLHSIYTEYLHDNPVENTL